MSPINKTKTKNHQPLQQQQFNGTSTRTTTITSPPASALNENSLPDFMVSFFIIDYMATLISH